MAFEFDEAHPFVRFLRSKDLSDNSIYQYMKYYDRFSDSPLTQDSINEFFSRKKTHNLVSRAFMRNLLEFLGMDEQLHLPSPPKGKKSRRIIRPLTKEQMQTLRRGAYKHGKPVGFMFDFLYQGGLRRLELSRMKVNSINWGEWFKDMNSPGEVYIWQGKGRKDRVILVSSQLLKDFLEEFIQASNIHPQTTEDLLDYLQQDNSPLFSSRDGRELSGNKIWHIIKKIARLSLKMEITPHILRHQRATDLEEMGMGIREIQHYLGHSSPNITEVYLHTSERKSISKIKTAIKDEEY